MSLQNHRYFLIYLIGSTLVAHYSHSASHIQYLVHINWCLFSLSIPLKKLILDHVTCLIINLIICLFVLAAGSAAKKYIDEGGLVPDDLMVDLIINELHPLYSCSWLLDGRSGFTEICVIFQCLCESPILQHNLPS